MRVLSLFDGMACGMLAMQKAGVTVTRYVAFEIDKYAVQTASHNFPTIEQRGNVFGADFTEFAGFDFLIGGNPCTHWSIARPKNRETKASGIGWELFSQYVRALHEVRPQYFVYENNKSMSAAIRESITQAFGFEPVCINSARVSAQNRQRLYWVGKREPDGTYSQVHIKQPEDRGIMLRDILEGIAAQPTEVYCVAQRGRYIGENGSVAQHLEAREDGKTNTITTVRKDNLVALRIGKTNAPAYQVKDGRILAKDKEYPIKLPDGFYTIRNLTLTECKRLQTIPDEYDFPVSDSRVYKMLGNGWTVDVIAHLLKACLEVEQ